MAMETLADELDKRLTALWHVLGRRGKRELSRTAASVLATLRDIGPRRITELAESEGIAQPTVTTLVGRLERDGLVERRPDPADARAVLVHLSGAGLERLDAMRSRARSCSRSGSPHSLNTNARYWPTPCPCWTS